VERGHISREFHSTHGTIKLYLKKQVEEKLELIKPETKYNRSVATVLDKFKQKFNEISKNGVTVPIKPVMLEQLIKRQSGQKEIKVEITTGHLNIRGTADKNVSYMISLKPIHMEKRMIIFEIESLKPTDMNKDEIKIFNSPPFSDSTNQTVKMDFNSWDVVKKIPVGKIKSYEMNDGTIKLTLSL
jgi:hypothetical protein